MALTWHIFIDESSHCKQRSCGIQEVQVQEGCQRHPGITIAQAGPVKLHGCFCGVRDVNDLNPWQVSEFAGKTKPLQQAKCNALQP